MFESMIFSDQYVGPKQEDEWVERFHKLLYTPVVQLLYYYGSIQINSGFPTHPSLRANPDPNPAPT